MKYINDYLNNVLNLPKLYEVTNFEETKELFHACVSLEEHFEGRVYKPEFFTDEDYKIEKLVLDVSKSTNGLEFEDRVNKFWDYMYGEKRF